MSQVTKVKRRRLVARRAAVEALKDLIASNGDPYLAYRKLYALWCGNNAAVEELTPLFHMEGISPDGALSVTASFVCEIQGLAARILPLFEQQSS